VTLGIALLISIATAILAVWQWIKYKNLWFWASREVGRLNLCVCVYRDTIRFQKAIIDELREG